MKIVVLSNCALVESQGSGYVILNYARELRARGHEVLCVAPETLQWRPGWRRAAFWRLSLGTALYAWRSRSVREADLVEFYGGPSWLAVLVLRLLRRRCALVHHSNGLETRSNAELRARFGADTHDGRPRRWYQWRGSRLVQRAFTDVDALVLVSAIERDFAERQRYQPPARLLMLETPLPPGFERQPLQLERAPVLGYCGPWTPRKGCAIVREVAVRALRRHPALRLRLVGVGTGFRREQEFPADVAPRIDVVPFLDDKAQLRDWYSQVSVLLMPSYSESFGLVVSEAMACGCAVVASATGFAAGLRNGEEAMVVERQDAAAFGAAVERLLADEDLRRAVAARGHARVQSLRWSDAGRQLEHFYRGLAAA